MATQNWGLGRRPLPKGDTKHLERYPLRLAEAATVERTLKLPYQYRTRYDQGAEPQCVGFASSWAMSILNRAFFDAPYLYHQSQLIDEWEGENYAGTSVRAGMDVLRTQGHRLLHRHSHEHGVEVRHGIERNEWTTTVSGVRACIASGVPVVMGTNWYEAMSAPVRRGASWWMREDNLGRVLGGHAWCVYAASDRRQAVKMTNSWGMGLNGYPLTWVPYGLLQRLLDEAGEATVIVDRVVV